jgi:hypothetical protein
MRVVESREYVEDVVVVVVVVVVVGRLIAARVEVEGYVLWIEAKE